MEICSYRHDEIVFDQRECPLCEIIKQDEEHLEQIEELKEEIRILKEEV